MISAIASASSATFMPAERSQAPSGLRERIEPLLASARVPGCSIAVVDRNGLIWADGFGFADLLGGRPAQADTVYHLFSGTKLFTAAAIMQLAERGQLSLDDPVTRHLPEAAALDGITLRHLLSHRSGLKESLRGLLATTFPHERARTAEDALRAFPLIASRPPGTRVEYRNTNFALLGAVIGRASGMEYRRYVAEQVLRPLEADCAFSITDAMRPRAAIGYMDRWDPMRLVLGFLYPQVARRLYGTRVGGLVELMDYDLSTAAIGGLVGTVPDFARFLRSQLAGGAPVLVERSVREMQTLVARGAAGIESREGVGLGWKFGRVGDRTFLNHEGGGAGFTSELRLYPQEGIGIALAMNAMRMPRTMRLAHVISERVRINLTTRDA